MRGQHRCRFVEDEHLRVAGQRFDDFDALLSADGEIFDVGVRVDVEAEASRDLFDFLPGLLEVQKAERLGGLVAQGHRFCDREDGNEHEVLVHHADACRNSVTRTRKRHGFVVDEDAAGRGLIQSVEDVHER